MAMLLLTLLTFSGFYFQTHTLYQPLRVYVDGVRGNDSHECLNSSDNPCESLSFVAENLIQEQFVCIEILGELLNLTEAVDFRNLSNLTIFGGSLDKTVIVCNESNAGLAFVNVSNLHIYSLTVESCGALRPSTSFDKRKMAMNLNLSVAVFILNCTDVAIWNVNIISSNGTGLSLYDTNGTVDISHCNFTENGAMEQSDLGGGGLHIEFTFCSPGHGINCSSHNRRNFHSTYTMQNCNFAYNAVNSSYANRAITPPSSDKPIPRRGQGGGLYISIDSDAMGNSFTIENCIIEGNVASYFGGGMYIEFLNSVENNRVIINQTRFVRNKCFQTDYSGGGGLLISLLLYNNSHIHEIYPKNNTVVCNLCYFVENIANMGGGTAVYAAKETSQSYLSTLFFSQCKWTDNESAMGAAVFISPGIWDYTKEGYLPVPKFTDCSFESNSAIQTLAADDDGLMVQSVGYGAVFISELRVAFEGSAYFRGNRGSAVHLSNSVMEYRAGSDVTFQNNTSHNGGAIAMYGSSMIEIEENSLFLWTNNTAYSRGGAIYFDFNAATHPAYHNCLITPRHLSKVGSTMIFTNNTALANGSSIFTTTFQSCALLCPDEYITNNPEDIMQCIANFTFDDTGSPLSTRPEKFELSGVSLPLELIPGTEYSLPLTASDEAHTNLSGVIYEANAGPNVSIDPAFFQVSNNKIKVCGDKGATATLQLFTYDLIVSVNITMTECQPGYSYNPYSSVCECAAQQYLGLEGCNPEVYLRDGYWMGYCSGNSGALCTLNCPYGYCSYTNMDPEKQLHSLPNDSNLLDTNICGPSRRNRLCGECSPGYSLYHNSPMHRCGPEDLCYLGWFFYLLSDIIPLTIFFVVILVLNISFTSGSANCFVLYGQIIGSLAFNNSIQFPNVIKWIQEIVMFCYNPFNMNFFVSEIFAFCPWKGASFMVAMMVHYGTIGFALSLVLMTIFITRYRYIHNKIFFKFRYRHSVLIHGLSAFFVLCYSRAVKTTFYVLEYSCLLSANLECKEKVVNYAGHMNYLDGEHMPYAIVAFGFLLFLLVIPPLLLLFYPLIFKILGLCNLSETPTVRMLWRVMPIQFLDAFQSSFKDKYRFFAGLYFLYRGTILALYVITQTWLGFYAIVQLLLTVILTILAVLQPHKERKHNITDCLLFANLCLINAITLYYYSRTEFLLQFRSEVVIIVLAVVQAILIILPLFVVITVRVVEWNRSRKVNKHFTNLPSLRLGEEDSLIQKQS